PRWAGDRLYARDDDIGWTTPDQRAPYAETLRSAIELHESGSAARNQVR
ncbi:MAG: hypothetical protein HOQ28_09515, partial [Thermoleophilia bacterium]|nr:hypothetical protein [Thermoleophilia bacterium]